MNTRPTIRVEPGELYAITDASEEVLRSSGLPIYIVMTGQRLLLVRKTEQGCFVLVKARWLRHELARLARYVKRDRHGEWVEVLPPYSVVQLIRAICHGLHPLWPWVMPSQLCR